MVKDAMEDGKPGTRQDVELVNSRIYKVTVGSDEYATVVLCRQVSVIDATTGATSIKPEWTIYCGDKQVSGAERNDGKTLASQLRKEAKVSNKLANALEASEWVAKVPAMAACGFFRMMARSGRFCSHTQAALANIPAVELE